MYMCIYVIVRVVHLVSLNVLNTERKMPFTRLLHKKKGDGRSDLKTPHDEMLGLTGQNQVPVSAIGLLFNN